MGKKFSLQITTPSTNIYEGEVEKLFLWTLDGELEILASHENMVLSTVPSIGRFVDENDTERKFFLSTSVVYVKDNDVKIFTDASEFPEDIDFERAEKARKRAIERLKKAEVYEKSIYESALIRANERLKLKK